MARLSKLQKLEQQKAILTLENEIRRLRWEGICTPLDACLVRIGKLLLLPGVSAVAFAVWKWGSTRL